MSNYYEESMPVETDNEDYLKYYLDDSLPLFQQLNTIIKKGEPLQRQALLSKLNIYQSTDSFKSLMEYILNDIETWDKETITLFPKYLYPLFNQPKEILMQSIDNELFNIILKKIIKITSSTDENILREYMKYLEKIILVFDSDIKFPYEIEETIYEEIISLGKVDETKINQQLSCCLCCTLIRVLKDAKNENVQKLFNRVCYLFSCCEKQIETQLSRELEFLFPIFKQKLLANSDVLNSVNSYLDRDSDFNLQSTTIISIIKNLEYLEYDNYSELIEKLVTKLEEIFDDEVNLEKVNKSLIFLELLKSLEKNYKKIDINIIKKLFEENFIAEFIMNNKEAIVIIENFDKIYFLYDTMFKELNILNNFDFIGVENIKEENIKLNYDELFFGIYNHYLNINYSNNFYTHRKKNYNEAENIERKILYNNLMKILPYLSNFKKNRYLFDKINFLFNNDNIIFALNCYAEKFNNEKNNILYNLMCFFLKKNIESQKPSPKPPNLKSISPTKRENSNPNHESHYVKLFNNILNNILHAFNETPNLFDNNIHLLLCDFFQKIIKKIYKYLKPTMRELSNIDELLLGSNNNKIKIKTIDKIYEDIYLNYLIKLMDNQQLGNHIRNGLIKIFPYLILYGKNRITFFKYIQENIIESKRYFNRRYSVVFLEKCLEIFSFKMFNKIGLSDFLIHLINDENNTISANIINLIYVFNKKITKNSGIMFKNIIKNLSKINMENKDNKLVHIEDFDIEKNRIITNILNLDLENKENKDNNEYWANLENKLIKKEKEIFGDDIYYGFHQLKSLVRSQTLNLNSQSLDLKTMNRKNSYLNNMINKEVIVIKNKDKISNAKKMLTKDYRHPSSLIIDNHKNSSKTFLPKIKQNRNSCININSLSTKILIRPNIKKINNHNKNKQENQKFHENNSKNNNSMILNEKSGIKTSYDFAKKGKSESKVRIPNSLPSFYPELLNNNNSISLKNENVFIEPNKLRFERKNKDMFLNTIYKSKNNRVQLEYNTNSNKVVKLRKDNLKENSGRINKLFYKINNGDIDKFNLTNVSLKEKIGQLKRYIK